jgi:chromosome partitioning protein
MIVTIADCASPGAGALVAENLALLRARSVRKVLLLDAGPGQACRHWGAERERSHLRPALATCTLHGLGCAAELERLRTRFHDIVIATDGCRGHECRWALVGAQLALVPLAPEYADIDARYELIARLNNARMFNPGLRVLFVTVANEGKPAPHERNAVCAYAGQVMAAGVAPATLHLPALLWGADAPGRCACDIESSTGAAEMAALYGEIYRSSPVPASTHVPGGQTITTIWKQCRS